MSTNGAGQGRVWDDRHRMTSPTRLFERPASFMTRLSFVAPVVIAALLAAAAPAEAAPRGPTAKHKAEARAFGRAIKRSAREFRNRRGAVLASLNRQIDGSAPCERELLSRPYDATTEVVEAVELFDFQNAILTPVQPQLERFAARLRQAAPTEPVLRRAAAEWTRYVALPRYRADPGVCAVYSRWKATGFSPDARPIDLAAYEAFEETEIVLQGASNSANRRLRRLGVSAETARVLSRGFPNTALERGFGGILF